MIKLFAKIYDKYVTKLETEDEIWGLLWDKL